MIASSATALANLAYLIGAVVVAVVGGIIVWVRHRQPKSVDANMASFRRGLNALAPETQSSQSQPQRADQFRVRPAPRAMTHVRLGAGAPAGVGGAAGGASAPPAGHAAPGGGRDGPDGAAVMSEEAGGDLTGGGAG